MIARLSREGAYIGKLHLVFEGIEPEWFPDYQESLTFSEWFVYCWVRRNTLYSIRKEIEEAGGAVLPLFINYLNLVDGKLVGIEMQPIIEIIRIG